ncbi:MAG: hypothetical protein V4490_02460 [Pseudomonadota bacterium]
MSKQTKEKMLERPPGAARIKTQNEALLPVSQYTLDFDEPVEKPFADHEDYSIRAVKWAIRSGRGYHFFEVIMVAVAALVTALTIIFAHQSFGIVRTYAKWRRYCSWKAEKESDTLEIEGLFNAEGKCDINSLPQEHPECKWATNGTYVFIAKRGSTDVYWSELNQDGMFSLSTCKPLFIDELSKEDTIASMYADNGHLAVRTTAGRLFVREVSLCLTSIEKPPMISRVFLFFSKIINFDEKYGGQSLKKRCIINKCATPFAPQSNYNLNNLLKEDVADVGASLFTFATMNQMYASKQMNSGHRLYSVAKDSIKVFDTMKRKLYCFRLAEEINPVSISSAGDIVFILTKENNGNLRLYSTTLDATAYIDSKEKRQIRLHEMSLPEKLIDSKKTEIPGVSVNRYCSVPLSDIEVRVFSRVNEGKFHFIRVPRHIKNDGGIESSRLVTNATRWRDSESNGVDEQNTIRSKPDYVFRMKQIGSEEESMVVIRKHVTGDKFQKLSYSARDYEAHRLRVDGSLALIASQDLERVLQARSANVTLSLRSLNNVVLPKQPPKKKWVLSENDDDVEAAQFLRIESANQRTADQTAPGFNLMYVDKRQNIQAPVTILFKERRNLPKAKRPIGEPEPSIRTAPISWHRLVKNKGAVGDLALSELPCRHVHKSQLERAKVLLANGRKPMLILRDEPEGTKHRHSRVKVKQEAASAERVAPEKTRKTWKWSDSKPVLLTLETDHKAPRPK